MVYLAYRCVCVQASTKCSPYVMYNMSVYRVETVQQSTALIKDYYKPYTVKKYAKEPLCI